MGRYELIVECRQPACGGRSPTASEVCMMETGDPAEYVRAHEPGLDLEVLKEKGVVTISGVKNGLWFKYELT